MKIFKRNDGRLGRLALALAALVSIAGLSNPAAADDWYHHRHHDNGFFALQFGGPAYYPPTGYYYPAPRYYYPPPAYYYPPPPPVYYPPSVSFGVVIPLGHHH